MRFIFYIFFFLIHIKSFSQVADTFSWKFNAQLRAYALDSTFKTAAYKDYAQLNHPKLVELMGGVDEFAKILEEQMKQIEAEITIDSMKFEEPYSFIACDSAINCLLPQTMYFRINDSMGMRSKVYLLGNSEDKGMTWYFVDGSNGAMFLDTVLPFRCKTLEIPEKEIKMINIKK
jgi:hypothetical protein